VIKIGRFILFILALGVLFHGLVALGIDRAFDVLIQTAVNDTALVENTLLSQSPLLMSTAESAGAAEPLYEIRYTGEEQEEGEEDIPEKEKSRELPPVHNPNRTERLPSLTLASHPREPSTADIIVRNHTTFDIDIETLLAAPLHFLSGENPSVLIYHTHGTESFAPYGEYWYKNTDNYRTNDKNLNITRIGREIAGIFETRGIHILHNQYLHDYPSFRGSYGRSLATAARYLEHHPEIQIIFDIHRDAVLDADGRYLRTVANIDGVETGQIMLVVGTDHAGLYHPNWRENFSFALRLQRAMLDRHPNLARPIALREERFNAQLAPGAILVEIGMCGNTLQEALAAGRIFAEIAADVILGEGG